MKNGGGGWWSGQVSHGNLVLSSNPIDGEFSDLLTTFTRPRFRGLLKLQNSIKTSEAKLRFV